MKSLVHNLKKKKKIVTNLFVWFSIKNTFEIYSKVKEGRKKKEEKKLIFETAFPMYNIDYHLKQALTMWSFIFNFYY